MTQQIKVLVVQTDDQSSLWNPPGERKKQLMRELSSDLHMNSVTCVCTSMQYTQMHKREREEGKRMERSGKKKKELLIVPFVCI